MLRRWRCCHHLGAGTVLPLGMSEALLSQRIWLRLVCSVLLYFAGPPDDLNRRIGPISAGDLGSFPSLP